MQGIIVLNSTTRNGELGQIREGDVVAAGQPFMSIVDPSSMVLNATVNQVDAEKLRLGMKATIRLDAYSDIELPGTLIGIGAIVLNGAKIGRGSVIAAGAVVPEGAEVPVESMVMGVPAKVKRPLTTEERERFRQNAQHYVEAARIYKDDR